LGPALHDFVEDVDETHFLAGRRSWIIAAAIEGGASYEKREHAEMCAVTHYVAGPVYFLETAAIERYSTLVYRLMSYDPWGIGGRPIRVSIDTLWATLLTNYVTQHGFEVVLRKHGDTSDAAHADWKWQPTPGFPDVYVRKCEGSLNEVEAARGFPDLMTAHPALHQQIMPTIGPAPVPPPKSGSTVGGA
jgi:hypothetical protein